MTRLIAAVAVNIVVLARTDGVRGGAAAGESTCSPETNIHMRHFGVCHCDCVFVDAGLNNGRSLTAWPRDALSGKRGVLSEPMRAQMSACLASSASSTTSTSVVRGGSSSSATQPWPQLELKRTRRSMGTARAAV